MVLLKKTWLPQNKCFLKTMVILPIIIKAPKKHGYYESAELSGGCLYNLFLIYSFYEKKRGNLDAKCAGSFCPN